MRNLKPSKILAILGVIVIPLAFLFSNKHYTAYADSNLSKVMIIASDLNVWQAPNHVSNFIPLQQRSDLSNENHADAFISFHYNWANDPLMKGLTDFYYQSSKDNLLASDILNEVVKTTGLNNEGTRFDNLEVLRNNTEPSTLIELGFLLNKQDDLVVESSTYFNKVAQGVYPGLLNYFSK